NGFVESFNGRLRDECLNEHLFANLRHARELITYRGEDVVATLEQICKRIGYPAIIRVDQGSEFISKDMELWAYANDAILDFSRPGKPTDNAFIEAFNGRFRAECLNAHWFMSLEDAAEKLEAWCRDYNEERPYGALGNKVPADLMKSVHVTSP
ncbi:integrase-like protein, partial [Ruegeria sp. P4]